MTELQRNTTDDPARALVPTPRETALGTIGRSAWPLDTLAEQRGPSLRQQIRTSFGHNLDLRAFTGPRLPLIVFAAIGFLGSWDTQAVNVLLPDVQASYHVNVRFMVNLVSVFVIVLLIVGPFVGYAVDRVKRLRLFLPGLALASIGRIGTGLAGGIGFLGAARTVGGLSKSLSEPPTYPLMADYYKPSERARTFSLAFAAVQMGTATGPLLSAWLAAVAGWRSVFTLLGVLTAVVTVLSLRLREPKRGALDRLEAGLDPDDPANYSPPPSWAESWRAASAINTMRRIWMSVMFLTFGGAELTTIILPLYYRDHFHVHTTERGYLLTLFAFAGLLGIVFSGPVADRLLADRPQRLMTLWAAVLFAQAGIFAVIAFTPNLWATVLLSLPVGFSAALLTPGLTILISLVIPARIRGLGVQSMSPFILLGVVLFLVVYNGLFANASLNMYFLVFAPAVALGGVVLLGVGPGLDRDIRSALASGAAEEEVRRAREAGRQKMIVCRDMDVSYDGVQVLFGVDFDVDEGEVVALVGTNGAGKSTLLCAIAGITPLATGAVFLDGHDVTHMPADEKAAKGVVMMPGGKAVFPTMSVADNLDAALWLRQDKGSDHSARIDEVYEMFPVLRERRDALAGNLSGGEQQMLGVAQAMLMEPRLLLIDELSLGLAPAIVEQLLDTVRLLAKRGVTIVLVEQSVNVALTVAERAVFMERGEIRFDGPTTELLGRPDLVRAVFMGTAASAGGRLTAGSTRRRGSDDSDRPVLSVTGVSATFGGVQALADVSLTARAGEIVGIIGPNGAGKTTLMDVISGLHRTGGGTVEHAGRDVTGLPPHVRARLGLSRSFQDVRLFPSLTVADTLAVAFERHFGMRSAALAAVWAPPVRRTERRIARRVERVISLLGLETYADKFVNELSTGTRRMVDIGCVLATEPVVLLLDEPASGLAQAETEQIAPLLTRLVSETGAAVVVIEHDMPLITTISDQLVAMHLGRVIAAGGVAEVVDHPDVVRSYLSASDDVIVRSGHTAAAALNALSLSSVSAQPAER
jgi:branched-chain amino acid transport system ATP-binding protein